MKLIDLIKMTKAPKCEYCVLKKTTDVSTWACIQGDRTHAALPAGMNEPCSIEDYKVCPLAALATKTSAEAAKPPAAAATEGVKAGFVDMVWLDEVMKKLRWKPISLITWLRSRFKGLDCSGTMNDVLGRLIKEQAAVMQSELNKMAEGKK